MSFKLIIFHAAALFTIISSSLSAQNPNESEITLQALDHWRSLKYGLFIHWGDYSEAAGTWKGEKIPDLGEQLQRFTRATSEEYKTLAGRFNPVKFDPDQWVKMAKINGIKYIILTSKHHNGFCMWDSKTTGYDIVEASPFGRDILKELSDACEKEGMPFGIYYSIVDWNYPGSIERNPPDSFFVFDRIPESHQKYSVSQLEELCSGTYGNFNQIFFDMGLPSVEQSMEYRNTVKRLQPSCLINGRVMNNAGDFLTMPDNAVPMSPIPQAWEAPSTLYHWTRDEIPAWDNYWYNTWGYKSWVPRPSKELQLEKQLRKMAMIVSRGGNFLLNIGPTGKGEIISYEQDILEEIGDWLMIYGDAIYETEPTPFPRNAGILCTRKPGKLFIMMDNSAAGSQLLLPGLKSAVSKAYLLADGKKESIETTSMDEGVLINIPEKIYDSRVDVLVVEYEGALEIEKPAIVSDMKGSIKLTFSDHYVTGSYDGESYSSLANSTHFNWDFIAPTSRNFQIRVQKPQKTEGKYQLTINDHVFPLSFPGDKNTLELGPVKLKKNQRYTLSISPDPPKKLSKFGASQFNHINLGEINIFLE